MVKQRSKFICQACGYESPKWMGKCPGCHAWNKMTEERESQVKTKSVQVAKSAKKQRPVPITQVNKGDGPRIATHMNELNRVLGGGVVPGSLILVGGDPGIGKSTLLLQLSHALSSLNPHPLTVLYVSGEESAVQTRLRADRLGALSEKLILLCETNLDWIEEAIEEIQPDVMIVDSIQTVYHPEVTSAPGSVSQVRECTGVFMRWAKSKGIATILVGHVTKEGAIAGPRLLEHMVDCVLYFEGERHQTYRLLRAVKNRFGSTNEIGIFEMNETGLIEVTNPSELFLDRRPVGVSGSAVAACIEGTRPVLVELQALVTPTHFPSPRRTSSGLDYNRLTLIMAVLEKRVGLVLYNQDAYVNAVGGVKLDEPAADLAIAVSIASGFRDVPTRPEDVFIGEVGLTGEVRHVAKLDQRIREAEKLGFERVFVPAGGLKGMTIPDGLDVIAVETVSETLKLALS